MCTVVRVSGTKSDATPRASSRATRRFAERFSFFSFKARPIDFSDRNVQFPDRRLRRESSAPPTFFRSAGEIFVFLSLAISTRRRRARWRITAAQERASLTATRVDRARSR